jgi:hypothetical protein
MIKDIKPFKALIESLPTKLPSWVLHFDIFLPYPFFTNKTNFKMFWIALTRRCKEKKKKEKKGIAEL